MRRLGILIAVLAVALFAGGCTGAEEVDAALQVRDVVRAYNTALAQAYAQQDMNLLNTVATEDQALTEFYQMAALGESRVRMIAELKSIEFGEVTFPEPETASVTTFELWDYVHESLDTSETVASETGIEYRLRYDLLLQEGQWMVNAVTSLDETDSGEETSPTP
ncbi:MAG: hypothetical protein JXE06_03685 [Coriobacteriia bacterium]|nr:hypothetical protein [Coriobacteriia bacterium]MBN2822456.1 hypothetical protein [Coriobacteriia bacterium]